MTQFDIIRVSSKTAKNEFDFKLFLIWSPKNLYQNLSLRKWDRIFLVKEKLSIAAHIVVRNSRLILQILPEAWNIGFSIDDVLDLG